MSNKKQQKQIDRANLEKNKRINSLFKGTLYDKPEVLSQVTTGDIESALYEYIGLNDDVAAKNLVTYFNYCFKNNITPDYEYLKSFVSHAFSRIVEDGLTPDIAFGFKKQRGKYRREDQSMRDMSIAAAIILKMRSGQKYLDAFEDVLGEAYPNNDGGEHVVKSAYSKYKDELSDLPIDLLEPIAGYL